LGEDKFVEEIERIKGSSEGVYWEVPIEEICREVMGRMGIGEERLYSLSRDRRGAYGRGLVGYLARKVAGMRVKEIAGYFKREPMTISFGVRKIEDRFQREKGLAQKIAAMELALRKKGKKKYFITIA
jgi:chromosomal replication initiation ATPase DnaA